ncbi:MAG: NTP transferase domain-containing protein [Sedimentisphaerales bacterium]|nr:NTP transferase domain-containing protein [Sedimentisphaerales bacterium]
MDANKYAVIMAGGSGKRLWPLSRKTRPKQIIDLFSNQSLLRHCVSRVKGIFEPENILVVTNAEYADEVHKHLPELPLENILGEPRGRDTANAIGLAATVLSLRNKEAVMAVFSADQIIEPVEPLQEAVRESFRFIESHPEALFTFGIKASFAHTGLGYLKRGREELSPHETVSAVAAFKEKPNKSTAHKYIRSGQYCWNSGMFVWRVDTILERLERFLPHNAERLHRIGQAWKGRDRGVVLEKEFPELEKISIDFGVMERAKDVYMCELECHWVDMGSYQTLADNVGQVDQDYNATTSGTRVEWMDSSNNIAISENPDHLIAAIHVEDMIIVHTKDATLICRREETENLKSLLERMERNGNDRFL